MIQIDKLTNIKKAGSSASYALFNTERKQAKETRLKVIAGIVKNRKKLLGHTEELLGTRSYNFGIL